MTWYWWLILGVLIGWFVSWLIEVVHWRWKRRRPHEARLEELEGSLDECHRRVAHFRGEIEKRDLRIADFERALASRLETPTMVVEAPEVGVEALTVEVPEIGMVAPGLAIGSPAPEIEVPEAEVRVDDLALVRGIGPKLAATLGAAGITSFAQIAEMDEAGLQGIIQAPEWRRLNYSDWILQARTLRDLPPAPVVAGDDLTFIEGIGPKYAGLLRDGGINTFAKLATSDVARLEAIIDAPAWRRVDYPMWIEQALLIVAGDDDALKELQDRLHLRKGDNLTLIGGIGSKAVTALSTAGITSFATLAAADEERLASIIEGAGLRVGDYAAWLEEAEMRAAGKRVPRKVGAAAEPVGILAQNLAAIRGIGPVFEQKFYAAGIGTYAELAALSDAEIEAIIQPKEWQDFDYESWNEQARRLAEKSVTVSAVWNGIIPDDLSKIRGIGDVFEQKLYEAGIMTFAFLAAATVAQLEAIIQPLEWQEVDFAGWVAQARDLAS